MRFSKHVGAVVLAAALTLTSGACGGGKDADSKGVTAPQPRPLQREVASKVAITARGGTDLRLESKLPVTVSTFEPAQRELRLLTFGLGQFATLDDGRRVRLAVDLAGIYDGPGRYEFGGEASSSSGISSAFLHVVALRDANGPFEEANVASATSFDRILTPCAVDIEDGERSGRLSCPRLGAADGTEIDLQFEWEAS